MLVMFIFEEMDGNVVICLVLVIDFLVISEELVIEFNVGVGELGGIWEENVCVDLILVVIWVVLLFVRFVLLMVVIFFFEFVLIKFLFVVDLINREVFGDEFEDIRDLLKFLKSFFVLFLIIKILFVVVVLFEMLLFVWVFDIIEVLFDFFIIGEVLLVLFF